MLAIGIGSLIFVEFTINVATVFGVFPAVGMPLPFFSYGGSSIATICVRLDLLIAIDRDSMRQQNRS
jgi:cell division protein FtsW (lipid II flippase)